MFRSLYRHRWLLQELVLRDLVLRYRGSALGFLWTLLTPLLFVVVYVIVFSVFLRIAIPHYAVFLIAGLLPWQWFALSLQSGTSSIVDGRTYVGKVVLDPVVLVVVPVLSNFVQFLLSLPILVAVAIIFHVGIGWSILALPLLIGIQLLLTIALLLFLATLNVFYRDTVQLVSVILTPAFFLTPIMYQFSVVPEKFQAFVVANPMAPLVLSYQSVFYYHTFPSWKLVAYALVTSIALFYAGQFIFQRYKDTFADFV